MEGKSAGVTSALSGGVIIAVKTAVARYECFITILTEHAAQKDSNASKINVSGSVIQPVPTPVLSGSGSSGSLLAEISQALGHPEAKFH
jgi:hypothetical protein